MSELDKDLVLQTLHRLEEKLDAQNAHITQNTLGVRRLVEKLDVRLVKVEKDVGWHAKWLTGTTSVVLAICGTLGTWLWNHIGKS